MHIAGEMDETFTVNIHCQVIVTVPPENRACSPGSFAVCGRHYQEIKFVIIQVSLADNHITTGIIIGNILASVMCKKGKAHRVPRPDPVDFNNLYYRVFYIALVNYNGRLSGLRGAVNVAQEENEKSNDRFRKHICNLIIN
jgi:hypothetical protein